MSSWHGRPSGGHGVRRMRFWKVLGLHLGAAQRACVTCPLDWYQAEARKSLCELCPAGKAGVPGVTTVEHLACTECPLGFYQMGCQGDSVTSGCIPCSPGKFSDVSVVTSSAVDACTGRCGAGTYGSSWGGNSTTNACKSSILKILHQSGPKSYPPGIPA